MEERGREGERKMYISKVVKEGKERRKIRIKRK